MAIAVCVERNLQSATPSDRASNRIGRSSAGFKHDGCTVYPDRDFLSIAGGDSDGLGPRREQTTPIPSFTHNGEVFHASVRPPGADKKRALRPEILEAAIQIFWPRWEKAYGAVPTLQHHFLQRGDDAK